MGRKPKEQTAVEAVEQTEEQTAVEAVELVGLQTIVGTGNSKHLKAGVEIPVSAELAMLLIKKGAATLKE